jgi:hypothetical protein
MEKSHEYGGRKNAGLKFANSLRWRIGMINEGVRITSLSTSKILLEWESPNADDVSIIYVNGVLASTIYYTEEATRSAIIDLNVHDSATIEVHDLLAGTEVCPSIYDVKNTQPALKWNYVEDAVQYYVYHYQAGDASESLIQRINAKLNETNYTVQCRKILDGISGKWHFFRVESVDEYGNISERKHWRYYVYEPPEPASSIEIENGSSSGLFNITITD